MTVFLIIISIIVTIMVGVIIFDSNRFVIREYTIETDKTEKDVDILFLSDLHCKEFGKENSRLLKAVSDIEADICLMAGDMIDANPGKSTDPSVKVLSYINKKMPVICSFGNHEYRTKLYPDVYGSMYNDYCKQLQGEGLRLYDNEKTSMFGMDVYSLSIDRKYYKRFTTPVMPLSEITNKLGTPSEDTFSVLLAHNPDYFNEYTEWGADLILSGHVHGGIVRIPGIGGVLSPRVTFFPKYDGGIFSKGISRMIVSRGIGAHSIPLRMFNPAEIIIIHIKRS